MIETPDEWPMEWIEMAWAARNAAAPALNATRRARFETVKRAIGEAELPKSVPSTNVMRLKAR